MRALKMSWHTEQGRLVCRWIETEQQEKSPSCPLRPVGGLAHQSTQPFTTQNGQVAPGISKAA